MCWTKIEVMSYADHVDICHNGQKVATHKRIFEKKKEVKNPLHKQKLLEHSGDFKYQRILDLIRGMDAAFRLFIDNQDNEIAKKEAAYQIFVLLKAHSRGMLISALRELNPMRTFKIKALLSLLNVPSPKEGTPQEESSASEIKHIQSLLKRSGIKRIKRLEDFDWKFNPNIPRHDIMGFNGSSWDCCKSSNKQHFRL